MLWLLNLARGITREFERFIQDFGTVYLTGTQGSEAAKTWQQSWVPRVYADEE